MGPQAKECGQHLEAGKSKKTDFLIEPQERNAALLTLQDLFPDLPNCKIKICGVLSH